ncbi:MAG: NAD(P)H-quinone oxidoreductase [Alphaproteobacteria bacterium]|nr:NAD(P)H-quinone oxidoreductase [Alphaproteobacteria bacterium]
MTAIEFQGAGGPEVIRAVRRPVPQPGKGELLLKVAAAGLNRADVMQRQGRYPMPPGVTDIPGLEASGTVVALGEGAGDFQAGDPVAALLVGGGYAEYVAVPTPQCLPVPKGIDLVTAATIMETFCTVWTNVFERGTLKAGETLLVQGGTSGIGYTAIQLGKLFGATVIATAGSDAKCRASEDFGADLAINYKTQDFAKAAMDFTQGAGVDVILDLVGAPYLARHIDILKREGRLVFVAMMGGSVAEIDFGLIQRKHLYVTGSTLRSRTIEQKAAICAALKTQVWPLIEASKIKLHVHQTYPLANTAQAHQLMESSAHIGKILLTM